MLLPAVFLALVLRTMDAFRVFDIVFATTNGGPADATDVLMIYGVKQGLQFFNIGFASAIANMMIVCIAVFSVLFIVLIRRADRRANELADEPPRRRPASLSPSAPRSSSSSACSCCRSPGSSPPPTSRGATSSASRRPSPSRRRSTISAACFRYFDLFHLVESSLVITLGSVALSLLIGIPAGYALARSRSRHAVAIAYFFLAIRTVPPVATLIPFYLMMRDIGLLGTWWAVSSSTRR